MSSGRFILSEPENSEQLQAELQRLSPAELLYPEGFSQLTLIEKRKGLQLCVPGAEIIHFWNQSPATPKKKEILMEQSLDKFLKKYYGISLASLKNYVRTINILSCPKHRTIQDLGVLNSPLCLEKVKGFQIEVGISPLFIPSARSQFLKEDKFRWPVSHWQKLVPGRYYLRLLDRYGKERRCFQFEKAASGV